MRNILTPVFEGYDFVAPDYSRYKFDGTITNTIAYNLTRALYGVNIRQPIGGEFGMSNSMVRHCLNQDVWDSDIAKFGVDIWLTITAITGGFRICQTRLGAKNSTVKRIPPRTWGPCSERWSAPFSLFLSKDRSYLEKVRETINTPIYGEVVSEEPVSFEVNLERLVDISVSGSRTSGQSGLNIIEKEDYATREKTFPGQEPEKFQPAHGNLGPHRLTAMPHTSAKQNARDSRCLTPLSPCTMPGSPHLS